MTLAIIAAVVENRGIGKEGKLPWHIPADLKRFKRLTTGHAVVMGRKTYESIGHPLSNRRNVVITSHVIPGIETYPSIDSALAALADEPRIFVIGGGQLYRALLPRADEVYLTLVHRTVEADTFFPPYEHLLQTSFREIYRETNDGFTFVDFVRI